MTEAQLRERLCLWGKSIFERGLTSGSSGNISVRTDDGFLVTPTNSCLGLLDPSALTKLDLQGRPLSGDKPSKEVPLHMAYYDGRPVARAIVHLHSTFAVSWSCRADIDPLDALPPLTPYVLMRVGRIPILPYTEPGTDQIRPYLLVAASRHAAVLLANHGPVVSGESLDAAVYAAEELEEAAKVAFLLEGRAVNHISAAAIEQLLRR